MDGYTSVFDFYNLKWMIKPQKELDLEGIRYSSNFDLDVENPKDRKKAMLYFTIFNEDKELFYFIDITIKMYGFITYSEVC